MNKNGRISIPVTTTDICNVLGLSDRRLSYLCRNTHGKINIWSRYKPVPFKNVSAFKDTIISLDGYSSWKDTPITEGTDGVLGNPWYMGGYSYKLYKIPTIGSINELITSGNPNPSSKWTYQAPPAVEGYACRMGDFVGYNHNARCPLSAYTNYTTYYDYNNKPVEGMVHLDGQILAGFNNTTSWDDTSEVKYQGELTVTEVLNMITTTRPLPLYLCIVIRNKTQNLTRHYSKAVNILDLNGRSFKLNVNSALNIRDGGVAHTVKVGDILELGIYLSGTKDSESIGIALNNGFSLYTGDASPHVCRTVEVGEKSQASYTWYKLQYRLNRFNYNAEGYIDELDPGFSMNYPVYYNPSEYGDSSGTPWPFSKGIQGLNMSITLENLQERNSSGVWVDSPRGIEFKFTIKVGADMYSGDDATGYRLGTIPVLTSAQLTGQDITNKISLNNTIQGSTTAYATSADAENHRNGVVTRVIPVAQPKYSGMEQFTEAYFDMVINITLNDSALFENVRVILENTSSTKPNFVASN